MEAQAQQATYLSDPANTLDQSNLQAHDWDDDLDTTRVTTQKTQGASAAAEPTDEEQVATDHETDAGGDGDALKDMWKLRRAVTSLFIRNSHQIR